jgi:hypothetical protein
MTNPSLNCLSEGETLDNLARRECAIGFDLRFCRSVAVSLDDRETITCDPTEAEFATLYALTDLNEAVAVHDVQLTSAGADAVAAVARAPFVTIVNAHRDPPMRRSAMRGNRRHRTMRTGSLEHHR